MTKIKKWFNIMLPYDMIAQAYKDGVRYGTHCFLVGPLIGSIPDGYKIDDEIYIKDKDLVVVYHQHSGYQKEFFIKDGDLMCIIREKGEVMAAVNLGRVVGNDGAAATITVGTVTTGAAGSDASVINGGTSSAAILNFTIPRGNTGETGAKGDDGISPTFYIQDGNLMADYDNPYVPNA